MFDHGAAGLGRRYRLTAGAITVIAACLMAAGCSGVAVKSAPGLSGFASPSEVAPHSALSGPPADPFAGTPADEWGDGVAGIDLPAARPIGKYTAAQVAFAYQTTRKLMAAADLDQRTLLGGPPTALADLLSDSQRTWFLASLGKRGLDKQGAELSTRSMLVSFPPEGAQLIGSVIKAHGTMRANVGTDESGREVLNVSTDYLFAYPVEPPHRPAAWMRIVAEMQWTVSFGDWPGGTTSFGPWISGWGDNVSGVQCGTSDGYRHPDYPDVSGAVAQPSDSPSGTPIDPYVLGNTGSTACQATTGT
jgi:hypothetical protein